MDAIEKLLEQLSAEADIEIFRRDLSSGVSSFSTLGPTDLNTIMKYGSVLLNWFIQLNWTGPSVVDEDLSLPHITKTRQEEWDHSCLRDIYDGETWYELTVSPHLLSMANDILIGCMKEDYDGLIWAFRCLNIQQRLLSVTCKSHTMWTKIQSIIDKLIKLLETQELKIDIRCSVHLELSNSLLYHSQYESAWQHLMKAQESIGISLKLGGALGKRTKFQQTDTAQLLLQVSQTGNTTDESQLNKSSTDLPKDILLDDDTLLSHVTYSDSIKTTPTNLTPLQQAVILSECIHHQWTNPVHRLTTEELEAYIEQVLSQPQCWTVQAMSLYLRSVIQRKRSRTVERSMMQLQELVALYQRPDPKASQRQELFYSVPLPPHWIIEKELANTLVSIGAQQSALDIYEKLQMWEEVITCYQQVGRQAQAERIVRERMKVEGESVKLLCLLGDVTQDPSCYEKAWKLSNNRSARAQKSLGLFHLAKEKFNECMECLQKSVNINPLQEGVWFTLGYAAGKIDDHVLAAHAFRQCVILEPDNAEAWNNLAGEYVKRNDKARAFNAFQEALKCNFENWKIWENYLLVSTDIGEFEEVIKSYHRILDLQRKHLDIQVLQHLTDSVVGDVIMRNGKSASSLRDKLGELLARIVSQTTGSSELWELFSKYHLSSSKQIDKEKGLIELQKAQRTARQTPGWEREKDHRKRVFDLTLKYCKACRDEKSSLSSEKSQQTLSSARLCLQGVLTKLKQQEEIDREEDIQKMIEELVSEQEAIK